jgi:hypothetical protein
MFFCYAGRIIHLTKDWNGSKVQTITLMGDDDDNTDDYDYNDDDDDLFPLGYFG